MSGGGFMGRDDGEVPIRPANTTIILDTAGRICYDSGTPVKISLGRRWIVVGCHRISWEAYEKLKQRIDSDES